MYLIGLWQLQGSLEKTVFVVGHKPPQIKLGLLFLRNTKEGQATNRNYLDVKLVDAEVSATSILINVSSSFHLANHTHL